MLAVLATSDKTSIAEFGSALHQYGWELAATSGTAATLASAGVPVMPVATLLQLPEMLGGRLKTLDIKLFGGLLYRRDRPEEQAAASERGFVPVDLVACNFYAFGEAAAEGMDTDNLVELIDVGGPSMVRAAAKNFKWVLPVVDPADYDLVLSALEPDGTPERVDVDQRRRLSAKAFGYMAEYDAIVAHALREQRSGNPGPVRSSSPGPGSGFWPSLP